MQLNEKKFLFKNLSKSESISFMNLQSSYQGL